MKSLLLIVALAGTAISSPPQTGVPDGGHISAIADTVRRERNTVQLRGHVEIRRGPMVLRADEADLRARLDLETDRPSIDLRGHVQMRIEDPVPLTVNRR